MSAFTFRLSAVTHLVANNSNGVLLAGSSIVQSNALTRYYAIASDGGGLAQSTESDSQVLAKTAFTLSGLWCNVSANSISSATTLQFRKNTGNGNQVVSITASTTGAFEDTTHTDAIVSTDNINYQIVTAGASGSVTVAIIAILSSSYQINVSDSTAVTDTPTISVPRAIFLEPGGDSTFDTKMWTSTGAQGTIATDFLHGNHLKSFQYAVNTFAVLKTPVSLSNLGSRISFYLYINAAAASQGNIFFPTGNAFNLQITPAGVLQIFNSTTQIGSNGATLSTGKWYRISLAYNITSTTVNEFRLFVDGTQSISITNATLNGTTATFLNWGFGNKDTAFDMRTSDHYIDNSTALTDPGNIWVAAKRPNANGTANNFTTQIGSGGSGYGTGHSPQVNERALSTTNGWSMIGAGSAVTEEYSVESQSTGDIDISAGIIVDNIGWVYASSLSSETGSIVVGGTSSNISLTSANTMFTAQSQNAAYPAGNTDIGIITTTALTTVSLYEAGVIVAAKMPFFISVSDSTAVTDTPTISLPTSNPQISVSDSSAVGESVTMSVKIPVFTGDIIHAVEQTFNTPTNISSVGSTFIKGGTAGAGETEQQEAQAFVASYDKLVAVTIQTNKVGTPSDNTVVTITSSLGGASLGSASLASSGISAGATTFTFGTPIALTVGNTYFVQVSRDGARDTSNYVTVNSYFASFDLYPGNAESVRSNTTWSTDTTYDANQRMGVNYTYADFLFVEEISFINVSDSSAVTDTPTIREIDFISVSDLTTVFDIAGKPDDTIFVFEQVTISIQAGVATLTINVSDSTAVSDTVTLQVVSFINVSDSTAIGESVALSVQSYINVSDSTSIGEAVTIRTFSNINVSDSTAIGETITMSGTENINVSDSTAITDTPTVRMFSFVNVSDSSAATDTITVSEISVLNVSDSSSIGEVVTLSPTSNINVTDSSAVSDTITLRLFSNISVSDSTAVTDTVIIETIDQGINVSDSTAVGESIQFQVVSYINVSDSSAVSDTISIASFSNISVSDSSVIGETVTVRVSDPQINVSDSTVVSENVSILLVSPGAINVLDSTTVSDTITIRETNYVLSVTDSSVVGDTATFTVSNPLVNISDSTAVNESVSLQISGVTTTGYSFVVFID